MGMDRNGACWCNSNIKYKYCHLALDEKVAEYKRMGYLVPERKIIKNTEQINGIRESGRINTAILDYISDKIKAGITTEDINRYVHEKTLQLGGIPATLGFDGFPKSVCVSVNNEVCHGIPSPDRYLKSGDIVNVDVSTIFNGYYGDSSRMFCIGEVPAKRIELVEAAKAALEAGLMEVKPFNTLGDMGQAIHDFIKSKGYSVVYSVGGHGVGLEFHEEPYVSYVSKKHTEMLMVPGMVFTIEPMINGGSPEVYVDDNNGWTVYTEDGSDSAQWEIMVLITDKGYEVLAH
ncbi:MAG: methionyl aminopeptidase [Anaerocolumna sp.]